MKRMAAACVMTLALAGCKVQEFEKPVTSNPLESARSRVAIAAQYLQKGDQEQALRHLQRALEQDPKSAEAHNIMGALMEREGDDRRAEESYRKAISLREDYPQAHNNYGAMLFRLGRLDESIRELGLAAANLSYDGRESSYENLGQAWLAKGDRDQARQAFEKALRLNGRMPLAALELAQMAYDREDWAAANLLYQRYVKAQAGQPQSARGLWLGVRLADQRHDGDARAAYALQLRRLYPRSPEAAALQQAPDSGR